MAKKSQFGKNEYNLDFLIRLSKELRWQMVNANGRAHRSITDFQIPTDFETEAKIELVFNW